MITPLLLVAALFSCGASNPVGDPSAATQAVGDPSATTQPDGVTQEFATSSLEYVYAFFRHGIRSPLYEPYPKDPHKQEFKKLFKGHLGELTSTGKRQMYKVGKKLYQIYGKFVGDFSEAKVRVSATETSRTIMTALSVMAGLFPPKKPLFKNLNWQPIPIWQDTRDFDKVYFYNDNEFPNLAIQQCPKYGKMIEEGYDLIKKADPKPERENIYKLLQKGTGRKVNSINTAYEIYDVLEFENLHGLKPPSWATEKQPEYNDQPLFPDLMRPLQVEWFFTCQWLRRNEDMLLFYSGPLFDSINDKLTDKITQKDNKELFRFHDTHDDTIYTLRWALGFDEKDFEVEPGDGIVFELHKQKVEAEDKYFVQVVYYHSTREDNNFREVLNLRKCPSPCPKEKFTKEFPGLTPEAWKNKCQEKI